MTQKIIDEHGRTCTKCGEYKAWTSYHKAKHMHNGYMPRCKECLKTPLADKVCHTCGGKFKGIKSRLYCSNKCKNESDTKKTYNASAECRRRQREKYKHDNEYREKCKERTRKSFTPLSERDDRRRADHYILKAQRENNSGMCVCWISDKPKPKDIRSLWPSNAAQAWSYWIKRKAPNEWVEQYYRSIGKPWNNPRLSRAQRYKMRYAMDAKFNLKERMRRQLNKELKKDGIGDCIRSAIVRQGNSNRVQEELGYSIGDLLTHLEKQFTKGMSIDKLISGEIHIDHIVPKASYNLLDHNEWIECWSLSNLQPLWAKDNLCKGAKITKLL